MLKVSKIVKETLGISWEEFCVKELKTTRAALTYRLNNNKLYPSEVVYIVMRTGKTVKELFDMEWHEALISSPFSNIDDAVKKMIDKMSEKEKRKLEAMLGFTN